MKNTIHSKFSKIALPMAMVSLAMLFSTANAFTPSTTPAETQSVPGNMLFALSVEWPTGNQISYTSADYDVNKLYEGYFDNRKCYSYSTTNELFQPSSGKLPDGSCPGSADWSGNILNWLTMSNLDQFRSVLTGGTRDNFSSMSAANPGDNATRTVLIRAFSDRNNDNTITPRKNLKVAWPGLPTGYGVGSKTKVRYTGHGSRLFVYKAGDPNPDLDAGRSETCAATVARATAGLTDCFNIRVEVCKEVAVTGLAPAVGRESNCVGPYGVSPNTYYKPQGLIQEYSNSIRFGALGYLKEDGQQRNGGVLRAVLKSVGATKIAEGGGANAAREWGVDGIMFTNPDTADATASGVTNSGVINYLNKFGYASGYKGNDPVGELYYAAQLYLRNKPFPTNYTDNLDAAKKDGFPVITNFVDPIVKSCQKNFILGIGDIYTHCDGNLPGSPSNGGATCPPGTNPTDPDGLNVGTLWNSVTTMEGSTSWVGGSTEGKPYMAGLAWWANSYDIRPDLTGKQNISTYWVDVLEKNNGGAGIDAKSQFWLTAKYGGYRSELVTAGNNNPNTVQASWDKDNNGRPDTLFAGNEPTVLRASLVAAFADIFARSDDSSASSAAVTSNRQTSNSQIVYAGYNPKNWTGGVRSCTPSQSAVQCEATPIWEVSRWFDTTYTAGATPKLNDTNRKIFTSWLNGSVFTEMPLLWASLNTAQKAILNGADSLGSDRVSYLRGSRAKEGTNAATQFRVRGSSLMGDVVNSNVTYLAGSGPLYRGANFPGHSTYRATNATRPPVIYVGANDGMLHAFDAGNGKELWAYIPGSIFANLPALTNVTFAHKYFVDGTAMVGDTQTGISATPWRTMLVGGLGGGGKGYFAIDISNQTRDTSITTPIQSKFVGMTETQLSAMPMWEFTSDTDLGFTYNEPTVDQVNGAFKQISKVASSTTASGDWRVIVGNGYGSTGNAAKLFMLNTETGAVAERLTAASAVSGVNNGLSSPSPVDTDNDGLIDTVYAGDLTGAMHKFQFSKLATNNIDYALAKSGDTDGAWRYIGTLYNAGQPITAAPVVTGACTGIGLQVLFGTGKLNENNDFTDTSTNSFYSVTDTSPSSSITVASTSIAPISYTASTVSVGTVRNWSAPSLAGKKGWKISFTGGERVISNPSLPPDTGSVLFGTSKPSGDLCEAGSSGYLMSVEVCSGAIGGLTIDSTVVGGFGVSASGILKISNTYTNTQNKQTVVCNQADCQGGGSTKTLQPKGAPRGRYSWRELISR